MEALKANDRKLGYKICMKPEIKELKHGQFIPTPRCKFSVNIPPPVSSVNMTLDTSTSRPPPRVVETNDRCISLEQIPHLREDLQKEGGGGGIAGHGIDWDITI
jgi:hypothetical protein